MTEHCDPYDPSVQSLERRVRMPNEKMARDYIGECALHQNREGVSVNLYDGLPAEDRIALVRMTTDASQQEDTGRWAHPPDEL